MKEHVKLYFDMSKAAMSVAAPPSRRCHVPGQNGAIYSTRQAHDL